MRNRNKAKTLLFVFVAILLVLGTCKQEGNKKPVVKAHQATLMLFSNPLEGEGSKGLVIVGLIGLFVLAIIWNRDRKLDDSLAANLMKMHEAFLTQNELHHKARQEQSQLYHRLLRHIETVNKDRHENVMRELGRIEEYFKKLDNGS